MQLDDEASLRIANPGAEFGIGPSLECLKQDAALAMECGGSAPARFRLLAPAGSPLATDALLTCNAGIAPAFMGVWGGIDLIRDVYSGAQSGALRITALQTVGMQVARATGLHVLTGL